MEFDPFYAPDHRWIETEKQKARKLRQSAWWSRKRSNGFCHYCRRQFRPSELTMDHVIPLSRGGHSTKENIVPCCKECNTQKKYLLPVEWADYLEKLDADFKK